MNRKSKAMRKPTYPNLAPTPRSLQQRPTPVLLSLPHLPQFLHSSLTHPPVTERRDPYLLPRPANRM